MNNVGMTLSSLRTMNLDIVASLTKGRDQHWSGDDPVQ